MQNAECRRERENSEFLSAFRILHSEFRNPAQVVIGGGRISREYGDAWAARRVHRVRAMRDAPPIRDRAFGFACDVIAAVGGASRAPAIQVIATQLVRSATSIGANLEEAKAASSRREFVRFAEISLREARETHYWLRIAIRAAMASDDTLAPLLDESDQLIRILTAIVLNTKRGVQNS